MLNYIIKKAQDYIEIDERFITLESNFVTDLHLNSYDIISIIGSIEDDLHIRIPDDEIRNLETVGELSNYLIGKICDIPKAL